MRNGLEKSGEDRLLKRLKPLADVVDLRNSSEVKNLAAMVPFMKGTGGGNHCHPLASAGAGACK